MLVVANREDVIVDLEGNKEASEFYGASMEILEQTYHDSMLVGSAHAWAVALAACRLHYE